MTEVLNLLFIFNKVIRNIKNNPTHLSAHLPISPLPYILFRANISALYIMRQRDRHFFVLPT